MGVRVLTEIRHEAAAVVGAGGQHDVARLDPVQRDRGQIGAEAVGAQAGRDDGHGLPGGDELELVLEGHHERAVGRGAAVRPGVDAPERVPGRVRKPGQRLVGDVVERYGFLAGQPVVQRHQQRPGLIEQDRHVQAAGRERQPGHHRVHAAIEQGLARLVPAQVHGPHVGVRVPVAQFPHGGGDDQARGVADGDPAGLRGGAGARRGLGCRAQQRPGEREKHLPGLGQPAALRGAVEQPGPQLLLEAADLPAQRRLGEMQSGGGAAEVPVLGDDREVAHQPQIKVRLRR